MPIMNGSGLPERQNLIKSLAMSLKRKESEIAFSDDIKTLNGISVIYHVESEFAWLIPDLTGERLVEFNPPTIKTDQNVIDLTSFNIERGNFHQRPQHDFSTGFTLQNGLETVVFEGVEYRWGGSFPKNVPANSTIANSGGVLWVGVGDSAFRADIKNGDGSLIGVGNGKTLKDALANRTIADVRDFGLSFTGVNDHQRLLNAVHKCADEGVVLGITGVLKFGGAAIDVTRLCDITGGGWLQDLSFIINDSRGEALKTINGVGITSTTLGGDYGFKLKKGRFIDFLNVKATRVDCAIKGIADASTAFHAIGLITIDNMTAINVGKLVELKHDDAHAYAYNDFKFTNSRGWFTRYGGFIAEQLDGLIYSDNLMHSNRDTKTHSNHLYVANAVWVNISGANTYFEGGREAIFIKQASSLNISGSNQIAFCGQQAPSSAVRIESTSDIFANISIADSSISAEKPTRNILDINVGSGSVYSGIQSGNIDERVGAGENRTYFGDVNLSSIPHRGVNVAGGVAVSGRCQSRGVHINSGGVNSALIDENVSTARKVITERYNNLLAQSSTELTVTIESGIAKTVLGAYCYNDNSPSSPCSGKITCQIYNSDKTKIAIYDLLYRKTSATAGDIKIISSIEDEVIVSDTPAFSFQLSLSGSIQVFPKQNTSGGGTPRGNFIFSFVSFGNLVLRS